MRDFKTVLLLACICFGAGRLHAYSFGLLTDLQFEDAAGLTAVDSSGGGRDAELYGDAGFTASGYNGGGLSLDGNGDYALITGTSGSAGGLTDAVTVCAWINTSIAASQGVVAGGHYVEPYLLLLNSDRTVDWRIKTETKNTRTVTSAAISLDSWHHLAGTYDAVSGTTTLYIDGARVGTNVQTGALYGLKAWQIGQRNNNNWFKGTLDDVRVYDRSLSAAEILAIYEGNESDEDIIAPTVPENVTAVAVSPRQVSLAWEPSNDNVKVTGYRVYKNGVFVATTPEDATGYQVNWLTPGVSYDFTVSAFDNAGNNSTISTAASAITLSEAYPDLYVSGWNVANEMTRISPACMETLRTKKVVGITKSFGGSMVEGYDELRRESSPYYLPALNSANPGVDDFDQNVIVKGDTTRYPYTFRVDALGNYMENWAGDVVDAAFVYWHNVTSSVYDAKVDYPYVLDYSLRVLDSLQAAYPGVRFIYTCSGIVGEYEIGKNENTHSMRFGEMMINRKRGLVPLYDMASILAVDEQGDTSTFLNPYSGYSESLQREIDAGWVDAQDRIIKPDTTPTWQIAASGLHPNTTGKKRMAKGMTLILAKMFCPDCFPQAQDTTPHSWVTDSLAVRTVLDANGLQSVPVAGVIEEKTADGRISVLSLRDPQAFTLTVLPSVIGDLDSLRTLYVYSNELTSLPASIGYLPVLEQLNISDNLLTGLPSSMANLVNLKQLTMNDNLFSALPEWFAGLTSLVDNYGVILDNNSICDASGMSAALQTFLDSKSVDWDSKQQCSGVIRGGSVNASSLPISVEMASSAITVQSHTDMLMQITLFSGAGEKLVSGHTTNGSALVFDIRSLAAGIYLLRVNDSDRSYVLKIAVVK